MKSWRSIIQSMRNCEKCQSFADGPLFKVLRVTASFKPLKPDTILRSKGNRMLFVSEAPPGGRANYGNFFWFDKTDDFLRRRLLSACVDADLIREPTLRT